MRRPPRGRQEVSLRARRIVRLFPLVSATAWTATLRIATAGLITAWVAAGGCAGPADRAGDGGDRSASRAGSRPGSGPGRDLSTRPIRIVATTGMAFTAAGLALLVFVGPATPLWAIVLRLALLGFGFALFSSPNMNAIMGSVTKQYYGVASAMLATMRLMGQMLSQGIATLLFALFIGRVAITPEHYAAFLASMKTAFAIFTILCGFGIFASLVRGKIR